MTNDITIGTDVAASADRVLETITTQQGQAGFWTSDCDVSDSEARFGFPDAPVDVHVAVERVGDSLVRWHCSGDFPGWEGSTIEWELVDPQGEDGTGVVLRHTGLGGPFAQSDLALGSVAFTWAMILDRLGSYVRDGEPVPYFG